MARPRAYLRFFLFGTSFLPIAAFSMMVRAALGHSGGDVRNPPRLTSLALVALVIAEIFRVMMPVAFPAQYGLLIAVSQIAWSLAYLLLLIILVRIFKH